MEEHLSWASFCSDRGEWVFFNEEKRLSPFYLLASLARAGSLAGTLCRVREVPLFCTTTHIGFFRKPTTNSAVVGNAPHNLRRRSQVSRTRHRPQNGGRPVLHPLAGERISASFPLEKTRTTSPKTAKEEPHLPEYIHRRWGQFFVQALRSRS